MHAHTLAPPPFFKKDVQALTTRKVGFPLGNADQLLAKRYSWDCQATLITHQAKEITSETLQRVPLLHYMSVPVTENRKM